MIGRSLALVVVLVALLASVAMGADDDARRAALERARVLVDDALGELEGQRADEAVELLGRARSTVPGEPVIAYDHGVALMSAGKIEEAREAYLEALRQGTSSVADVAVRARHNLGLSHLEAARTVAGLLQTPGALESAVRAQGSPTGEPLTPASVAMLAEELRGKALDDGLTNARAAIEVLRDTVRTTPDDADAVRNMILAQRVRRFLEEEKRQQEQQSEREDKGDQSSDENQEQDQQKGQGDESESEKQGEDPQQKPSAGDEEKQEGEQQPGSDGESTDSEQKSGDTREGEPRDVGREEAERQLDQLLDAASLKARQVERIRAERLRRGAGEKDW